MDIPISLLYEKDEINIENNFLFYFYLLNDPDLLLKVDKKKWTNEKFLYFILSNKDKTKELLKKNSLVRYRIIDILSLDNNIFSELEINLNTIVKNENIKLLYKLWEIIRNNITHETLSTIYKDIEIKADIIKDIKINRHEFYYFLLNKNWLLTKDKLIYNNGHNVDSIAKKIILLYYFKNFNNPNIEGLLFDEDKMQDYLTILIKYNDIYKSFPMYNKIVFTDSIFTLNEADFIYLGYKEKILTFINYLILSDEINLNVITWFYIIFINDINDNIKGDFLSLILNINKNHLGIINNILLSINKDFYKLDKKEFEKFIENLEKNSYTYKLDDVSMRFVQENNIRTIVNNLYFLYNLRYPNTNNNIIYNFLHNENTFNQKEFQLDKIFFILKESYLENNFETIEFNTNIIYEKYENLLNIIPLEKSIKIFNSVSFFNNEKTFIFLNNKFGIKILNFDSNNIENFDLSENNLTATIKTKKNSLIIENEENNNKIAIIDLDLNSILFCILSYFGEYGIIPQLNNSLKYTLINYCPNILFIEKLYLNLKTGNKFQDGYRKFE